MTMEYTDFDKKLRQSVLLDLNGTKIKFQFPPKMTTDSRKGEWKESNIPGTEPVAVYERSGPREMTLVFTYIVDGSKEWDTYNVSAQVHNLRRYFARYRNQTGNFRDLIVRFKMWYFGGEKPMSFRIKNVDVKHSETIVAPEGNINQAYSLRTDVTVELRMWTMGGAQKTQDMQGLEPYELPGWY